MMAFFPLLAFIRSGKILENSTDYSIQNTTRHALFLPTSREAKYKAKTAIDSSGERGMLFRLFWYCWQPVGFQRSAVCPREHRSRDPLARPGYWNSA
jgi:hypothetical protein